MLEQILEAFPDETFVKAEGFDEAIIGVDEASMKLVYSISKCIDILSKEMSIQDAIEYFNYNVKDSYVGEKTPLWLQDFNY